MDRKANQNKPLTTKMITLMTTSKQTNATKTAEKICLTVIIGGDLF